MGDLTPAEKTGLLTYAAIYDATDCAKWLREVVGAPWPDSFWCYTGETELNVLEGTPVRDTLCCWDVSTFRWARASGASWGDRRCQGYDEAWYDLGWWADSAKRVFIWAHANGCPCTCESSIMILHLDQFAHI